jgi:hypothetical protein
MTRFCLISVINGFMVADLRRNTFVFRCVPNCYHRSVFTVTCVHCHLCSLSLMFTVTCVHCHLCSFLLVFTLTCVHCHLCSPELFVVECCSVSRTGFRLTFDVTVSVRFHFTECPIYRVPDQNSYIAHTVSARTYRGNYRALLHCNIGMNGFLLA